MDLLVKMIPSRKGPKEGDIFVIQPKKDIYLFGKVIRTKIPNKDPMINGWSLIYLYQSSSKDIETPGNLTDRELLIPPKIVNNQGWSKGYFYTIGNSPLKSADYIQNYGFWDIVTKQYVNEEGDPLSIEPEIYGDYGLGSYGSVAYDVNQAIEQNPELLK